MQHNPELIAHLQNNPQHENIFFNEEGEWLFHSHPSYTKKVHRDEVIGEQKEETSTKTTTKTKK